MWAACIQKGRDLHALSVFPICIYWSSKAASAGNLRRLPCFWFTKSTPGSAGGQKEAYGEGKSRQEKVSELE